MMFESEPERKLRIEFEGYRDALLATAAKKYELIPETNLQFYRTWLQSFWIFKSLTNVEVDKVWRVRSGNDDFILCSLGILCTLRISRNSDSSQRHLHFFALVEGTRDFGSCMLQPETLAHKIQDFFHPIEIDFNRHPAFSSKYFCVANDPLLFRKNMTMDLLNFLATLKNIELECHQHAWLFKTRSSIIDTASNAEIFDTGISLSRLLR